MAKTKSVFFCSNCGNESPKWIGKCPSCGEWNTYTEEVISTKQRSGSVLNKSDKLPEPISDSYESAENRLFLSDSELNRVLGGGIVAGSVVLLGGEPGIGKSTLLLQSMLHSSYKCLYVSGEESKTQVNMRAKRLGIRNTECYMLPETQIQKVITIAKEIQPEIMVIDSIQTMESDLIESAPGTVSQVKECTALLIRYAKQSEIPIFIVGHINKDGMLAGPKVLEHMADVVLQFEGEKNYQYRTLRTLKNRFGSTNEIGLYEMLSEGLKAVSNPSDILLSDSTNNLSGVAIGAGMEGNTPILIEIQALVSPAVYGTPQRNSTGFDIKRLNMLLAVLEKRSGFLLTGKDVFVNIAGGFKSNDPGLDLAVAAALISSFQDMPISKNTAFAGEIGLSGEVRPAFRIEQRILEAEKLGLEKMVISEFAKLTDYKDRQIKIIKAAKTDGLPEQIFE
ncbi:MAG: DNA repair protein RadA [Bacteroidia bacterium]|nr:DNA repair protein RadA [Bacteroidia bacterium]MCO5253859.1 DNA repair protein RadA [Bacteroidota bacterium]